MRFVKYPLQIHFYVLPLRHDNGNQPMAFKAVMTRKKTEYYVNNKEFLAAITDYRQKVHAAKEAGCDLLMICHQQEASIQVLESFERQGIGEPSDRIRALSMAVN